MTTDRDEPMTSHLRGCPKCGSWGVHVTRSPDGDKYACLRCGEPLRGELEKEPEHERG